MPLYTKNGDQGYTTLTPNTEPQKKSAPHFTFLGDLDELCSHLGKVKQHLTDPGEHSFLETIQKTLYQLAAALHDPTHSIPNDITAPLEHKIDALQSLHQTTTFTLPGETPLSATLDIARTVARRAERSLCVLAETAPTPPQALPYLNRLSDYLFAYARHVELLTKIETAVKQALPYSPKEFTLQNCKQALQKIERKAQEKSTPVAIAFCDAAGNPILAAAMENALLVSFECAIKKAYTAVALQMPTHEAQKLVQPNAMFYGLPHSIPTLLTIPGGIPICVNKTVIGGVGVSGGDDQTDKELAQIGVSFFTEQTR